MFRLKLQKCTFLTRSSCAPVCSSCFSTHVEASTPPACEHLRFFCKSLFKLTKTITKRYVKTTLSCCFRRCQLNSAYKEVTMSAKSSAQPTGHSHGIFNRKFGIVAALISALIFSFIVMKYPLIFGSEKTESLAPSAPKTEIK